MLKILEHMSEQFGVGVKPLLDHFQLGALMKAIRFTHTRNTFKR